MIYDCLVTFSILKTSVSLGNADIENYYKATDLQIFDLIGL